MFHFAEIIIKLGKMFSTKTLLVMLLAGSFSALVLLPDAYASIPNRVYRVDIRPKPDYTRITVRLEKPANFTLATLTENRLRLIIQDTDGPLFKKFRRYSDVNI